MVSVLSRVLTSQLHTPPDAVDQVTMSQQMHEPPAESKPERESNSCQSEAHKPAAATLDHV